MLQTAVTALENMLLTHVPAALLTDTAHSAFGKEKCTLLSRKIERKSSRINCD